SLPPRRAPARRLVRRRLTRNGIHDPPPHGRPSPPPHRPPRHDPHRRNGDCPAGRDRRRLGAADGRGGPGVVVLRPILRMWPEPPHHQAPLPGLARLSRFLLALGAVLGGSGADGYIVVGAAIAVD